MAIFRMGFIHRRLPKKKLPQQQAAAAADHQYRQINAEMAQINKMAMHFDMLVQLVGEKHQKDITGAKFDRKYTPTVSLETIKQFSKLHEKRRAMLSYLRDISQLEAILAMTPKERKQWAINLFPSGVKKGHIDSSRRWPMSKIFDKTVRKTPNPQIKIYNKDNTPAFTAASNAGYRKAIDHYKAILGEISQGFNRAEYDRLMDAISKDIQGMNRALWKSEDPGK